MKNKITLFLLLISVSFMFASPFSVELSISGGVRHIYTDSDLFNNDPPGIMDESSINIFLLPSIKPSVSCFYHNTGLYLSADKALGRDYFKRYFILSGGLKQRVNISDKDAVDVHVGTTWHSVDAAIHSFMDFFVDVRFQSLPGLDLGVSYMKVMSETATLFTELNYNYNLFNIAIPEITHDPWKFRTISLNAGVMFSLL